MERNCLFLFVFSVKCWMVCSCAVFFEIIVFFFFVNFPLFFIWFQIIEVSCGSCVLSKMKSVWLNDCLSSRDDRFLFETSHFNDVLNSQCIISTFFFFQFREFSDWF